MKTEQWQRQNGGRKTNILPTSTQHPIAKNSTQKWQASTQLEAAQISHMLREVAGWQQGLSIIEGKIFM